MKNDIELNLNLYKKYKSEHAPDSFHHVAFKTQNYEKMITFYEKLFGCKPMYKSKDIAFLAFDFRFTFVSLSFHFQSLGSNLLKRRSGHMK